MLEAIVIDANAQMVSVGRDRAIDKGIAGVDWLTGDAERLPLPDCSADAVTISFGLRNVTDRLSALREMRRILKPGGRFFCLEFSKILEPTLQSLYDKYSFSVIPALGQATTGDRSSYQYLVESIRRFPNQPTLAALMEDAGFDRVSWRDMTKGVVALHRGWRL
jgi:demethylmenaquinone methyltransferase/2-methoxy-6-polyprenyl-1,4-benzoquinol methylase